jgi:hypothetical protein
MADVILVVDDADSLRGTVGVMPEPRAFEPSWAADGRTGFDKF